MGVVAVTSLIATTDLGTFPINTRILSTLNVVQARPVIRPFVEVGSEPKMDPLHACNPVNGPGNWLLTTLREAPESAMILSVSGIG